MSDPSSSTEMTLLEHLQELRRRLLICLLALGCSFILGFFVHRRIFFLLLYPVRHLGVELIVLSPTEKISVLIKTILISSVVLSSPIILHQVWSFTVPALTHSEKRYLKWSFFFSIILFLAGTVFAFFLTPWGLKFLLELIPEVRNMISLNSYLSFLLTLILAFGLVFQFPLIAVFLTKINLITYRTLQKKRKHAILGIFILAAILTPTVDPLTLILLALPLIALYEISIWTSWLMSKKSSGGKD